MSQTVLENNYSFHLSYIIITDHMFSYKAWTEYIAEIFHVIKFIFKIKEQTEIICDTLCSYCTNMSKDAEKFRDISSTGLKTIIASLASTNSGATNDSSCISSVIIQYCKSVWNLWLNTVSWYIINNSDEFHLIPSSS